MVKKISCAGEAAQLITKVVIVKSFRKVRKNSEVLIIAIFRHN